MSCLLLSMSISHFFQLIYKLNGKELALCVCETLHAAALGIMRNASANW